ncbi:MAG: hypothetical protein Q9191_003334 [Dirinaria sp. TL-2023a]
MAFKGFLPSPGASPKGSLSKSSAKRRIFLRETEDDSGPMYIEEYIYRRDRYRSSSTPFPFPLPMSLETIPPHLASIYRIDSTLRQLISKRLTDQGIQAQTIEVGLQHKHGYPKSQYWIILPAKQAHTDLVRIDGDKKVPVLLILCDAGESNPLERWSAARRDITKDLDDNGLSELEVEIQDRARHYQPSLFPIHPNNKAVALYKSIRGELLVRVYNNIGHNWQILSLFEVGRMSNSKKATIVLMVSPVTEADWSILKASLEAIVRREQEKFGVSLQVEIMPGGCRAMPLEEEEQEPDMPGQSFVHNYNTYPRQGTSIGVLGERGGGTLGGFFRMYFARKDAEATVAQAIAIIESRRSLIDDEKSSEQTREERGLSTPETRANLEAVIIQLRQAIQATEEILKSAKKMPRLYGRTILASGRALTSGLKTLDYAFVETSEIGDTRLPDQTTFDIARADPTRLGFSQALTLPPKYSQFSNIRPGQWYFKVGRTTGLTSGICNGVETWVRPTKQHTLFNAKGGVEAIRNNGRKLKTEMTELQQGHSIVRLVYEEDGKPVEMEGEEGLYYADEWVIVNGSVNPLSSNKQEDFCASGESGALIIDTLGRVAGLLWGDLTGFCGPAERHRPYIGAGMVTDINDVKSFMKGALGWSKDSNVDVLRCP